MQGRIIWWSSAKTKGILSATDENGENRRYFILLSRILSAPEVIEAGDHAKFTHYLSPKRPDLLPVAVNVVISKTPFVDAGLSAFATSQKIEVRE
jgi:hypothetical protein